jgi:MFS family permease
VKGFEKRLVVLTMCSHALVHFFELSFPPVLKLVSEEYQLTLAGAGGLGNVFPFFFGLGAIPAGMIVDRFGSRRTLLSYLLVCGGAGVLTLFVKPLWGIALLMFIMGAFAGLYHPAGLALLARHTHKIGEAMGLHGVGGNLGVALAPLYAATIASLTSWRGVYASLALPAVLLALWFRLDTPIWRSSTENSYNIPTSDHSSLAGTKESVIQSGRSKALLFWTALVILFVLQILNGFCYRGLLTFLPTFFSEEVNHKLVESRLLAAGGVTTAILIIGVIGQYLGGLSADRWKSEVIYAFCFTMATPFLFSLAFIGGLKMILSAGIFAFVYFGTQPVGNKLLAQITPGSFRGRAFGLFFFANFGIGSFSSTLSGWIGERFGLDAIFIFLGVVLLGVSLVAWGLVWLMKRWQIA